MQGIRRKHGVAQSQKAPVLVTELRRMVASLPATLKGHRDRALLLLGFSGAFRRGELVAIDVEDVSFGQDGLTVQLRRSKTDQDGEGRKVGIPYGSDPQTCPVRTVRAWLDKAGKKSGALFMGFSRHGWITGKRLHGSDVARLVKSAAAAIGLDASLFSGHSLRAGLVTSAAKAGKSERTIMAQTGHRSVTMVRRYIRDANLFSDNAAAGIGL
jgi:integrase